MSAAETVTLTIDDREVAVAKGTGLVETALAAGIEIPVFCYEPRLGPAVGACRMCLVEVEGMPKLQAGCTLAAQDGMVVKTAATSDKAAEGQNATLEFILVNHPLDCPVCDKGGECPLQDLTFRYGPGATRMRFAKRTFEKPIPISPTISLDRERCILCYRCTRFSGEVAEDGQLIAQNRGAASMIATFQDEPYRAPFSGNVTELCPVGALLPTQYRFQARPWEIQNVPTICGLCPVGCNVQVTTREGKAKRVLSRNHPEVDGGWLCDKGRFAFSHPLAPDRIREPLRRFRQRGFAPVTWDEALDEAERMLREAQGNIVVALSGSETVEQAYGLAKLMRIGLGAHSAVLPEATDPAIGAFTLPLAAIADAQVVLVIGDDPIVERAPVVELWIKAARRKGAEVVEIGPTGSVHQAPGSAARVCRELTAEDSELGGRIRGAERAILIWSGPGGRGGAHVAALASALGLGDKPGSGAFYLPATPNGRGVAEAWACAADAGDEHNPEPIKLLLVSGDEAAADPNVRVLAERSDTRDRDHHVPGPRRRLGRPRPARHELPRARRDVRQPRGPPAAPAPRGHPAGPGRDGVDRPARGALRRRALAVPGEDLRRAVRAGLQRPPLRRGRRAGAAPRPDGAARRARGAACARTVAQARRALPAPAALPAALLGPRRGTRSRTRVPAGTRRGRARARRRAAARHLTGRRGGRALERHLDHAPRTHQQGPREGRRAHPGRVRARPARDGGGDQALMVEEWWISVIKSVVIINVVLIAFALTTVLERKLLGRMQLRYGPNRAGPYGLLQPFADLIKLVRKESFVPETGVSPLFVIAPVLAAFTAFSSFAVIPFGPGWEIAGFDVTGQIIDVPIALIFIFALGSLGIYGFIVGGWASDSKYSLLGSMRTCAQLVSYEVSLALSVLGVILMAGSLSLPTIVEKQDETLWFVVPQLVGFLVFIVSGTAETSRAPFDLPEADTELVAGYHTEYGGMRWGLFAQAEYVNMITLSALAVTLFLGGWHFFVLDYLGPLWFVLKVFLLVCFFIWLKATLPRLRYDQLMRFGWKVLLPVATVNAVVTAALVVWVD